MCGILGVVSASGQNNTEHFQKALMLLKHRGPDAHAVWHENGCSLGHTRLSIIDLSREANQPMIDPSGRYAIVFNGEIYNYLELREELRASGAMFRTHSDTEVILEAYKAWGHDALSRFNGMWALAIYDKQTRSLFLSRDRFGVKPLYYTLIDGQLCFSSEMKALLALGAASEANWRQISSFLHHWGCDSHEETVFRSIRSLPAGHILERSSGGAVRQACWWNITDHLVQVPDSYEDRREQVKHLLEDAVRIRLRNDVDTGVCLSGGLDSSTIYGAARKLQKNHNLQFATSGAERTFRSFSVSYPGSPTDEWPWIESCLDFWNDREQAFVVFPKPDAFASMIEDVVWHQEAPVWSASVFALHCLYKEISAMGTKVILEGHGGDELLAGYPYLIEAAVSSYTRSGKWANAWQAAQCLNDTKNPVLEEIRTPVLSILLKSCVHSRTQGLQSRLKTMYRKIKGSHMEACYVRPDIYRSFQPPEETYTTGTPLSQCLLTSFRQRILPIILRVIDRATMAYGIESRAPYLDYRLVQYLFSCPDEDKVQRYSKHIMRDAAREWVPENVRLRTEKLGFAIAAKEWFNERGVKDYLADVFHSTDLRSCGLFETASLVKDFDRGYTNGFTIPDTARIWEVLNIYLWHKRFVRETL